MATLNPQVEILIIGAGQAGLALGYHLRQTSLHFQLVDGHARLGDSWRKRYDSLRLFTPRAYSALPGLALTGDAQGYANKNEFADYLEAYAAHFRLPVALNTNLQRLERADGQFRAITHFSGSLTARTVILATGAFQQPLIPPLAACLSASVRQFSSADYKCPEQIPPGTALVVGDGATGRDIAAELAATHRVLLAVGRPRRLLPNWVLGRSAWWWFDKFGLLRVSSNTALGRQLRQSDPFPGRGKDFKQLARKGVKVVPRLTQAEGQAVTFSNGETATVDIVVWATGYKDQSDWVTIPEVKDAQGNFIHQHGISPVAGLYFIGRPWQRNRGSALILGVGEDAAYLTKHIVNARQYFSA